MEAEEGIMEMLDFSTAKDFLLKNIKGQTLVRFPGVFGKQT